MVTYLVLLNFTEQGIKGFKKTTSRASEFAAQAKKAGVEVKAQYWTVGSHDGALILQGPDEASVTAVLLSLGALGNVRTQSLRAFDRAEMDVVVAKAG